MACSPCPTVHCAELWYADGNVVFQAQHVLFRVYRGILAANSSVFADLFSLPQPPAGADADAETYEGCPLIHIPDDAEQFQVFLKAIHDANFYVHDIPTSWATSAAVLRLATKYNVPYLRARALHQLGREFPRTLADFEALQLGTIKRLVTGPVDLPAMADLAREADARHLLPAILYALCASPKYLDLKSSGPQRAGCHESRDCRGVCEWAEEVRRCRDALRYRYLRLLGDALTHPRACDVGCLRKLAGRSLGASEAAFGACHRIVLGRPVSADVYTGSIGLCGGCAEEWVALRREAKRKAWEELPVVLDLPGWDQLGEEVGV